MTSRSYAVLDAELERLIGSGVREFSALISNAKLRELARSFVSPSLLVSPIGADSRIIDRRLQALRKAGRIKYGARTGWHLIKEVA